MTATVTDAKSRPVANRCERSGEYRYGRGAERHRLTGADRAGNTTTTQCPYNVVVPTCLGLTPTRVGTPANDVINATAGRDVIVALGGSDTINGNDGDDVICGGDGVDTINGGNGADAVDGGPGNDTINGGDGNDSLDGGAQNDSIRGDGGTDTCTSGEVRMASCEVIR